METGNSEFGRRLKELREALGLNQTELAQVCGVSQKTVSAWETGTTQVPKTLEDTLAIRGVRLKWWTTGQGSMFYYPPDEVYARFLTDLTDESLAMQDAAARPMKRAGLAETASTDEAQFARDFARVSLLGVRASAGGGLEVAVEEEKGQLAFQRDWISRRHGWSPDAPSRFAVISVEGDSMEPTLSSGDVLLVDTARRTADRDGIYVIRQGNALQVKRLQRLPDGALKVISDNPRYEPMVVKAMVPEDQTQDFEIAGRVVWLGRDLE